MNTTIGILAHVDAGKTTLSEQLLYHSQAIRTRGRVDNQDAYLDSHPIERARGITIFSGQACFRWKDRDYTLLDTPGHADFSAEMERAIQAMDYAVIVVSCVEGVQGHTEAVWRLLRRYEVPTLFFLNKVDREGAEPERVLNDLVQRLSNNCVLFPQGFARLNWSEPMWERLAELDDQLLEWYLKGVFEPEKCLRRLRQLLREQRLFPCLCGSALRDVGVRELLDTLNLLTLPMGEQAQNAPFAARVYQIRHDNQGKRLTFLKVTAGTLRTKDEVACMGPAEMAREKVNEIRRYSGEKYVLIQQARAGDLCAVTGPKLPRPGDGVGALQTHQDHTVVPMLTARVLFDSSLPAKTVIGCFRILEEEDPQLQVSWVEALQELHVHIMGSIQLEILQQLVRERFGIEIQFGECEILYQETIAAPVVGYGHFEPLRHYAEVHVRLTPGERGSGVRFATECPTDVLESSYQHLVRTHVLEKEHKGMLTGSPLTDVCVTLLTGRAHLKHTEGGDFREATYRAIRQGLEQAEMVLLEPYYAFSITVPQEQLGKVLSDLQRLHGRFEPPELTTGAATVCGRGPVACFLSYGQELTAFSKGKGTIHLAFGGYEPCHNTEEVIGRLGYDKARDTENPSSSVFCSHGSGFVVKWNEVPNYIHCKS